MKIVTHNAKFHTDDVFAVATLLLIYPEAEVVRTRDEVEIESADIVVDVGMISDSSKYFDHHQIGGAGARANGVPYASFGLVWKKFGEELCGSKEVVEIIDENLVAPIDAADNGVDISKSIIEGVDQYNINNIVNLYRPTWKEDQDWDKRFFESVEFAKFVIQRNIKMVKASKEAEQVIVDTYNFSEDKRIITLDKEHDFGREVVTSVLSKFNEPLYAVLYRSDADNWQVVCMRKKDSFESIKPLPEGWRAKRDEELEKETGVSGAVFCHKGGFMCIVGSKEGALALANKALNA